MQDNLPDWYMTVYARIKIFLLPTAAQWRAFSNNPLAEQQKENYVADLRITVYGKEQSFDIVTWNIENFPKDRKQTIPYLVQIIRDIDVDFIAIQELGIEADFKMLLDSLPGWQEYLSKLPDQGKRLGILSKRDFISISESYQI